MAATTPISAGAATPSGAAPAATPTPKTRSAWHRVAMPTEHGGWALTLEPVLLGLLVAWSVAGLLIGLAAFVAFLVRTPLKLVAVDRRRGRWLDRTRQATLLAAVELVVLAALAAAAIVLAGWSWLIPIAVAIPLVVIQLAFDARSRSRRLLPEVCGASGMAGTAAAIVVADHGSVALAVALWLVLAGRSVAALPFVRAQVERLHGRPASVRQVDAFQLAAVTLGLLALAAEPSTVGGLAVLVAFGLAHVWWVRRPPVPAKILGFRQLALGLGLVAATASTVTFL